MGKEIERGICLLLVAFLTLGTMAGCSSGDGQRGADVSSQEDSTGENIASSEENPSEDFKITNSKDTANSDAASLKSELDPSTSILGYVETLKHSTQEQIEREKLMPWEFRLKAKLSTSLKLTLSWEAMKDADGYTVYRAEERTGYSFKWKKKKKTATLSPDETTFQVQMKPGERCKYVVEVFQKEKKNTKVLAKDKKSVYAGVYIPHSYYDTSYGTRISVSCGWSSSDVGIRPDGVEIYRGDTPETCHLIKDKLYMKEPQRNSLYDHYTDQQVVPGHTYYYLRRNYKDTEQGRVYSGYTAVTKVKAVYRRGQYQAWIVSDKEEGKKTDTLVVAVRSCSEANEDVKIFPTFYGSHRCTYKYKKAYRKKRNQSGDMWSWMKVSRYSRNGRNWRDLSKDGIILSGEETVYLELKRRSKKKILYPDHRFKKAELSLYFDVELDKEEYEDNPRYLTIYLNLMTGKSTMGYSYQD